MREPFLPCQASWVPLSLWWPMDLSHLCASGCSPRDRAHSSSLCLWSPSPPPLEVNRPPTRMHPLVTLAGGSWGRSPLFPEAGLPGAVPTPIRQSLEPDTTPGHLRARFISGLFRI